MKLEQAENKWAFECQRRQFLEEEIKKLRVEIAVVRNTKRRLFWQQEESGKCKIYIFIFYLYFSLHFKPETPVAAQLHICFAILTW